MQRICIFGSVHSGLSFSFENLAVAEGIKCPSYDEPTANATEKKGKLSRLDQVAQAVWIMKATQDALSAAQMAWCTATYDGAGEAKRGALDTLCAAFSHLHANATLLAAVIDREFMIGETYCPSFGDIAKANNISKTVTVRLGVKVQKAALALGKSATAKLHATYKSHGWLPR